MLWYDEPDAVNNAVGYAKFRSRSHDAVIRVYDAVGAVIETHEHAGDFKELVKPAVKLDIRGLFTQFHWVVKTISPVTGFNLECGGGVSRVSYKEFHSVRKLSCFLAQTNENGLHVNDDHQGVTFS